MPLIDRVLIVGTGFMGNALANALYDNKIADRIAGIEPNPQFREQALGNDCYSEIESSLEQIDFEPDLAVICSPIETVVSTAGQLFQRYKDMVITDIASVKRAIVDGVTGELGQQSSRFVPAHPITGSDRTGPIQPPASIFTDRACVITRLESNEDADVQLVDSMWSQLGSRVYYLSPDEHDLLLGMTSHMPHAVASALSASLNEQELEFCGTGIRDTIRIAKSNPLLWKQIFVQNRDSVLRAMDRFQDFFSQLRHALETDSVDELVSLLEKGQKNRDALGN